MSSSGLLRCSRCGDLVPNRKDKKTDLCFFCSSRRNGLRRFGKKRVKK